MEKKYYDNYDIIKNPEIIANIDTIINNKKIIIKTVIIPIRNYELSSKSHVNNGQKNGGLWNANDEKTQIIYYNKIMSNYIYYMTKYDINTIFIDFDKMIEDKKYLFDKLKLILDEKKIYFNLLK